MFWGTRATNFAIYTTKMKGAGPQILGTGAKFKQVPCQKNCRVNRALIAGDFNFHVDCHSDNDAMNFAELFLLVFNNL